MPQCASVPDMFAVNRAAMPFIPCVFRLRRGVLPPPCIYSPRRSYSMYYKFVGLICKGTPFFGNMQMLYDVPILPQPVAKSERGCTGNASVSLFPPVGGTENGGWRPPAATATDSAGSRWRKDPAAYRGTTIPPTATRPAATQTTPNRAPWTTAASPWWLPFCP